MDVIEAPLLALSDGLGLPIDQVRNIDDVGYLTESHHCHWLMALLAQDKVYLSATLLLPAGVRAAGRPPPATSQSHHEIPLQCAAWSSLRDLLL